MQRKNPLIVGLPVVYGFCIFLFFWKYFPYHLHYQEQFQLFLLTKSYFVDVCSRPGGFCNYAGRFLTQFNVSSIAGALLVSCLLTAVQQLVYAVIRRFSSTSPRQLTGFFLSFLPSLFYWYLLCDENWQTGGVIALLITLIAFLLGTLPKNRSTRLLFFFASTPILYWLTGGVVLLSVMLLMIYEWTMKDERWTMPHRLLSIVSAVIAISLPFIAKYFFVQYPLSRYFWGVDYVHFVNDSPVMVGYLWIMILLIVTGVFYLINRKTGRTHERTKARTDEGTKARRHERLSFQLFNYSVIPILIYLIILKIAYPHNLPKEEIMAYDYHCRMQNWEEIITMAEKKSPAVPMTVTCLNLALYKTGQLPDRMFDYFQNGPEGLLPNFQRDFMIPTVGGEPYWYLGFVNTAQRFAFEAMEAFPDYQKSVRSIKRLAETNLVNGYYEVASKYLALLEKTLFYRNWAKETRTYLYDEAKISSHPEWGKIRRFQTGRDFLFSSAEKDRMLGLFFQQKPDNRMAYEYLMAYALLTKDIRNFPNYYRVKKDFSYNETPKSWQEALAYIWGLSNNNMDSIPYPVSPSVKQQVVSYAEIYTSVTSPEPALRKQFSNTYWYYYQFRNYKQSQSENILQY